MTVLDDIFPGELLIDIDKVNRYAVAMMNGDKFPPPEVYIIDNMKIVRDGNHRVCAWILCQEKQISVPMKFVASKAPSPSSSAQVQLKSTALLRGNGLKGFLSIPRANHEEYDELHGKKMLEIREFITNQERAGNAVNI